jgi:putative Ca2+/H+ antiporter (TMEM165/GDT1 family)
VYTLKTLKQNKVLFFVIFMSVAFGGIVSLFLGCSILSMVEIIYFMTVGYWYQRKQNQKLQTIQQQFLQQELHRFKFLKV